ncbi:MAG: Holliday junction resolvase RuvX [Bradyrhizobium sp.]|nr:MAG: Holliday junction resolvase RuvX [Bradyrhizobium sp.]
MSPPPLSIETLAARLPAKARLIGVDLGDKTIGLALSDVERRVATPLTTIRRSRFAKDAEALIAQIRAHEVFALVIGLPLSLDGAAGPRVQSTRAFARNFAALDPIPVVYWDERMSTAAVQRDLIANDVSRARRAQVIDQMAAAYILQGALDRLAGLARQAASAAP